jgi:hypothetical protein
MWHSRRGAIVVGVLAGLLSRTLPADAPPPPNPAVDAGAKWPARRQQLETEWLKLLGPFPAVKPSLDLQILSTELLPASMDAPGYPIRAGDITRTKVKFRAEADAGGGTQSDIWIYGWLLVPQSVMEAAKKGVKSPAIICLHSTTYGSGKSSAAGLAGRFASEPEIGFVGRPDLVGRDPRYNNNMPDPNDSEAMRAYYASGRACGLLLARQGFVTLSIDLLGDGERIEPGQRPGDTRQFYKQRYPDPMAEDAWSIIGKSIWDVMRTVDCLQSLPYVNPKAIGCTGWSYGGHVTLFAAAFDQRIAAAVPNGGVLDWDRPAYPKGYQGKPKANAWCRRPATMEPWTADGAEPPSSGAESLRRWGFLQNSGPVLYIPKFYKYTLPENRDLLLPVGFDSLMMMVAPRPLMIISSEIEFKQHDILPKCMETIKVYYEWQDVKGSGLPSPFEIRKELTGYTETLEYYRNNNEYPPKVTDAYLKTLKAGDCFTWYSFPGGHSYPFSAQMVTTGWFGRWLGLYPAAPVPPLPRIPTEEALHIGPLPNSR